MRRTLATGIVALTLLAACGDDDAGGVDDSLVTSAATDAGPAPPSTAPATAPATDVDDGAPQAIISLASTHTEILFAIGAGDQVIAVDDESDYPAEAEAVRTALSGFEPNVEAIAGYEPDLVVVSDESIADQLEAVGIDVWLGPAAKTLAETYGQIEGLGALTGHEAEAAELVARMRADIDEITSSVAPSAEPLEIFHELDSTGFTVDSTTFIGAVYSAFGLRNVADRVEGDHGGYPQLNAETIIAADPDLIFLADVQCCNESAETVAARPGWGAITAVANGHVFEMNDDIASRWGPRVVDYFRLVAAALDTVNSGG